MDKVDFSRQTLENLKFYFELSSLIRFRVIFQWELKSNYHRLFVFLSKDFLIHDVFLIIINVVLYESKYMLIYIKLEIL